LKKPSESDLVSFCSKDILSRWTFPLVPDDNHPGGHIYEHTRGNRYIAKDSVILARLVHYPVIFIKTNKQTNYTHARTCNIGTNTLIGSSTQVAENVQIIASVIGQNCTIGAGSIIKNSYIFENTIIGVRCVVERSIIGAGVMIKDGSHVPLGCLIAEGVVIGPDAMLDPYERLSVKIIGAGSGDEDGVDDDDDDDDDVEEVEASEFNCSKSL
jgi:translation initiation factor eIF-2B subunit epsilon